MYKPEILNNHAGDLYAIYLRKSRADLELEALGEGETLARHRARLLEVAERYEITQAQITIYEEIVSGESIQDRPEMQRLLSDVYAKKYKGVLVVEVERLARGNTRDQGEVADAFQYGNTLIITPSKVYDPNNEFDQEYFEFGLFMSRREYKTIRRRLEAGKTQSVMEGNYLLPQRIIGYNIEKKSKKDRYLVINEDEAKIVHMIFDWFTVDRKPSGWIARKLTLMGIPTMRNSFEWSKRTIDAILRNKHYLGLIVWAEYKTVKKHNPDTGKTSRVRVKTAPENAIIVKGKHEAIISNEQFELAQSIFASRNNTPTKLSTDIVNPFAGILHCAKCGKSMYFYDAKDGIRQPRFAHRSSAICRVKSLPVDVVTSAVVDALKSAIADFTIKMDENGNASVVEQHAFSIATMEDELRKLDKKRERLFDNYEDGVYTKAEFIERKQKCNAEIEKLKTRLQTARENMPTPINYPGIIGSLHEMIDYIQNPDISAKVKNDLLKKFIADIKYDAVDYGKGKGGRPQLDVCLK